MIDRSEKAQTSILKALNDTNQPMGASRLASALLAMGLDLQPRTIRFHLLHLDERGFTRLVSRRRGRVITERGRQELARSDVRDKLGFIAARMDTLKCQMTFRNPEEGGTVIINVCLIRNADFSRSLIEMKPSFSRSLAMGTKLIVARSGKTLGGIEVPKDTVALGIVCNVTLKGLLLCEGIPLRSRFGGLLEMHDRRPVRFVEAIKYAGSTLDPFEVFIKADMTRVRSLLRSGSGVVCASFCEIPAIVADEIRRIQNRIHSYGLGRILAVGRPDLPLFGVPVSEGYAGMILLSGLNSIAAAHEVGVQVSIRSLAGTQEYHTLTSIDETRRDIRSKAF